MALKTQSRLRAGDWVRRVRLGWLLVLLGACATGHPDGPLEPETTRPAEATPQVSETDLVEELRRYIDGHRPDVYETVFDGTAVAPVDRLQVEWQDDDFSSYTFVAIAAHGDTADVVMVESEPWFWHLVHNVAKGQSVDPMECQWAGGAWASRATIPRGDFDLLARKVALVERARSHRRPEPKVPFTSAVWAGSFSVCLDGRAPIERGCFNADLAAPLDDAARALLITWLVLQEVAKWAPKDVLDPEAVAPLLLKDLAGTSLPWQRPARIRALGRLGCSTAVPVLERLEPAGQDVNTALAQIRLIQECRGAKRAPVPLMDLAASRKKLQPWALALLAERFPDACRAVLYRRFDSRSREQRDQSLSDLHAFDPADLTLARRARKDPDERLRVRGAVMLDDWELLLALTRDAAVLEEVRFDAIHALTDLRYSRTKGWSEPPGDRQIVGQALIGLLDDTSPEIRRWAAGGIAALGYREAVPALLATLGSALSEPVDGDRAAALASALGYLRSKEAIQPLGEALERHASEHVGVDIGLALASMADPDVLPILRRHADDDLPYQGAYQQCFYVYDTFREPNVLWIFESQGPGAVDQGPARYISELLADLLTVEELRMWASRYPIVERSVALKEGRR
jgi:HEAT repeats